ncbi:MAG: hypothetical protein LC634_03080, partial [Sphingomonadales bacterium]|nr:hypothetical protein [Sphingomonadales bacterium]
MSFAILLSALALAGAGPASEGEILVTGERPSAEAVRDFIRDVGREAPGDQLARWDRAVCPYVTGLRDPHNAYIAETITALAQAVGAEPGGEGCAVNLVLIVNAEPGLLVGALRQRHPWMFDSLQPSERRRLEESSAPARSWGVVTRRGSDGRILQRQGFGKSGLGEARTFGFPDTEILAGVLPSRIVRSTRSDLGASFILLDAARLEGLSLQQISGYA